MNYRSKHLPIYTMLIGLLLVSIGFNILLYGRIIILQEFLKVSNPWVSEKEFKLFKQELFRLENIKYDIISLKTNRGE